jgi:hypothetical protein
MHIFTMISEKLQKLIYLFLYHLQHYLSNAAIKAKTKMLVNHILFSNTGDQTHLFVQWDLSSIFQPSFSNDNWQVTGGETRLETTRHKL